MTRMKKSVNQESAEQKQSRPVFNLKAKMEIAEELNKYRVCNADGFFEYKNDLSDELMLPLLNMPGIRTKHVSHIRRSIFGILKSEANQDDHKDQDPMMRDKTRAKT